MASQFCSACGSPLNPDQKFCRQCGEPVTPTDMPAAPAPVAYGGQPPAPVAPQPSFQPLQPGYMNPPQPVGDYWQPGVSHGGYTAQPYAGPSGWGAPPPVAVPGLVQYDVEYPQRLSRLLIFVKGLLIFPQAIVLMLYGLGLYVVTGIAWWVILFTGRYPPGMWQFAVRTLRFSANLNAYSLLLRDDYPPFNGMEGAYPPVRFSLDYPQQLSRGLIFIKWLLVFPHYLALGLLSIGVYVALIIAFLSILFTGKFPPGMFNFVVGFQRWGMRVSAYQLLLTDRYPPFSMDAVPQSG